MDSKSEKFVRFLGGGVFLVPVLLYAHAKRISISHTPSFYGWAHRTERASNACDNSLF